MREQYNRSNTYPEFFKQTAKVWNEDAAVSKKLIPN